MSPTLLLNTRNLYLSYTANAVVRNLSFSVSRGEVVAMIGANGCGKSTLLDTIMSRYHGDGSFIDDNDVRIRGELHLQSGLSLAYLPQNLASQSIMDYDLLKADPAYFRLGSQFGLAPEDYSTTKISDGQRQKLGIIQTILSDADMLIFDEPTNYLDIDGITALEEAVSRLKKRHAGMLIVSHDRALINHLADRTIYLQPDGNLQTDGGFSAAWSLSELTLQSRQKLAGIIKQKISRLQSEARERMGWAAAKEKSKKGAGSAKPAIAKQAKKMAVRAMDARKKAEKEIERLKEAQPILPKKLNLRFPEQSVKHRNVFTLENGSFSYSESGSAALLMSGIDIGATTKDKICLMGTNGTGKSTLFRIILGELRLTGGKRTYNNSVVARYVPQGLGRFWTHPKLLDNFRNCGFDESTIRQYLGAARIRRDKVHEPVTSFSQGELMRAALVRCILERVEFMFLDEPTSHLDIESIEVLESLLTEFAGGYLVISHDRTFVENISESLYLMENGGLRLV